MAYNQRYNPDALPAYVPPSFLYSLLPALSRAMLAKQWLVTRMFTGRAMKG